MKKAEFLQKLQEYLVYELPRSYVEKNLDYYDEYIDAEVRSGRPQAEVLNDLGDPQLIARTIIDAAKSGSDGIPNTGDDIDFQAEIFGNGDIPGSGYGRRESYGGSSYTDGSFDSDGFAGRGSEDRGGSPFGSDGTGSSGDINEPYGGWHVYQGNGCFFGVLFFLIIFSIFSVIGWLIGALSPVLAPILIVLLIMWLLRRRQ